MIRAGRRYVLAALVACGAAGCLFSSAPPPRYYAPPSVYLFGDPPTPPPAADAPAVRIRRLRAAGHLGPQMVWRVSDVERGLYEQRRWTEVPTRYLDRALVQALDHTPGVRRVDRGRVPTLDVELIAFDEVVAPDREAEVAVVVSFRDADQAPVFDRVFTAREPIGDERPASTARAMGAALDEVVRRIADEVAASAAGLARQAAAPPTR